MAKNQKNYHEGHKTHEDGREAFYTVGKSEANDLRLQAQSFTKSNAKEAFDFGELLYFIYYSDIKIGNSMEPIWKLWGFEDWFMYCECELHLHAGTASGYRNVFDIFGVQLEGKWDKSQLLPITKMKILSRIVNVSNVKQWMKKASKISCCQLEADVEFAISGKQKKLRSFAAKLTDKDFNEIKSILKVAGEEFEGDRGETLTQIFRQWNELNNNSLKMKQAREKRSRKPRAKAA